MEPTRQTVVCEHVTAARGSFATLNSEELSEKEEIRCPENQQKPDSRFTACFFIDRIPPVPHEHWNNCHTR
jgi:hypothetical protein